MLKTILAQADIQVWIAISSHSKHSFCDQGEIWPIIHLFYCWEDSIGFSRKDQPNTDKAENERTNKRTNELEACRELVTFESRMVIKNFRWTLL